MGTGIGAMLATVIGVIAYFKDHKQPIPNADVAVTSAALFSDATQIKRLILALENSADCLEKHTDRIEKLDDRIEDNTRAVESFNDLMKDEAKARLEAQIERRLRREHGERG